MDYKKTGGGRAGKNQPRFRDENALGGRNNPFGNKTKPVSKAGTAKPADTKPPKK